MIYIYMLFIFITYFYNMFGYFWSCHAHVIQELIFIPGDTLVACSYASYVGVFTRQYREETVDAFVNYLTKKDRHLFKLISIVSLT